MNQHILKNLDTIVFGDPERLAIDIHRFEVTTDLS